MAIIAIWESHLNAFNYRYMLTLKIKAYDTYKKEINQKHIINLKYKYCMTKNFTVILSVLLFMVFISTSGDSFAQKRD